MSLSISDSKLIRLIVKEELQSSLTTALAPVHKRLGDLIAFENDVKDIYVIIADMQKDTRRLMISVRSLHKNSLRVQNLSDQISNLTTAIHNHQKQLESLKPTADSLNSARKRSLEERLRSLQQDLLGLAADAGVVLPASKG